MTNHRDMEIILGKLLLIGVLISAAFVLVGGILYLYQQGQDPTPAWFYQPVHSGMSVDQLIREGLSLTPLGLINIGILLLVATQSFRVALLVFYYARIRDMKFALISGFILLMLVYSAYWRN